MVKTGGPWDYKQFGIQYENFGNFHYGVVGRAFGISSLTLKSMAGAYQIKTDFPRIHFWNWGSYFDDPRDTVMIQKGINFYNGL